MASASPESSVTTAEQQSTEEAEKARAIAVRIPPFVIEPLALKKHYIKGLFYGPYGIGKTLLAGTSNMVPSMKDVIFASAEAGDLTLQGDPNFADIDIVRIANFRQLGRFHEYLKLHCQLREDNDVERLRKYEAQLKQVDIDTIKEPKRYRTVVVDSLSEIESYYMYQLLGITGDTKLDDDMLSPEWAEYKRNFQAIQLTVRRFRDLPMHLIMTCTSVYAQDQMKQMTFHPNLTGKLSKAVQGFMDVVGYMTMAKGDEGADVRRLYVQPIAIEAYRFDAKNRFTTFKGTHFDNPTMESILQAVGLI